MLWAIGASMLVGAKAWHVSIVERVHVQSFDADKYYREGPKPILISNVLSPDECELCSDKLLSLSKELHVDLQNQFDKGAEVFHVSLEEALDAIMYESSSRNSYLTFCEGLLESHDCLQGVRDLVGEAKLKLFRDDPDWFTSYFPRDLQPSDAVIIAGAGATSTLHRDPFEWMGMSLCIEGSKIWRLINPLSKVESVDDALSAYRLESIAWKGSSLSAGWQSDESLFATRRHELLANAQEWSELGQGRHAELLRVGSSTEVLTPGVDLNLPLITAVQEAGDVLLIPAHWWHQTYALEPSAAIASQRCGKHDSAQVLQHILNHKQVKSDNARGILERHSDPACAVKAMLSLLML